MADVSKINGYNVKDSTARSHISNRSNPHNVTAAQVGAIAAPAAAGTDGQVLMTGDSGVEWKNIEGKQYRISVPASGWVEQNGLYVSTISVPDITASDDPVADIDLSGVTASDMQAHLEAWNKVSRIRTADSSIVLYCTDSQPDIDFVIKMTTLRIAETSNPPYAPGTPDDIQRLDGEISQLREAIGDIKTEYTASEQAIGTWIDGRTVYRRVVSATSPATGSSGVIFTPPEAITVIRLDGRIYCNTFSVPINAYYDNTSRSYCRPNTDGSITLQVWATSWGQRPVRLFIEYVKGTL